MIRRLSILAAGALIALASPAAAAWQTDGAPVCTAAGDQFKPVVVLDGYGGAYVVWEDHRGADPQIYAQHLDSAGDPQWGADGILVSSGSYPQYAPVACGDGIGGIYIVWILSLVPGAYQGQGQHLNSLGQPYWSAGGVPVLPGAAFPTSLAIVPDLGNPTLHPAGAILAWTDVRSGPTTDIWIHAFTYQLATRWDLAVCTATGDQSDIAMVSDGAANTLLNPKGAILTWLDERNGSTDPDIYAQRVDYLGTPLLGANGLGVAAYPGSVQAPKIVRAGSANSIVVWPGPAASRTYGNYADRVGSLGTWGGGGVTVTSPNNGQQQLAAVTDQNGGVVVAWTQITASFTRDLYVERLDGTGARLWGDTGKLVCLSDKSEGTPVLSTAPSGGTIVLWVDNRNELNGDIYAQLIDANGDRQWTGGGVPVCRAVGGQTDVAAVPDTSGGAIVAWTDYRNGGQDIYAQRVTGWGGVVGVGGDSPAVTMLLSDPSPNPTRGALALTIELPVAERVDAGVFDTAGRRVRTLMAHETLGAGPHRLDWDGRDAHGSAVPPGVYWLTARAGGATQSRPAVVLR